MPRSLSPGVVFQLLSVALVHVLSVELQTLSRFSGTPFAGVGHSGRWHCPAIRFKNLIYFFSITVGYIIIMILCIILGVLVCHQIQECTKSHTPF